MTFCERIAVFFRGLSGQSKEDLKFEIDIRDTQLKTARVTCAAYQGQAEACRKEIEHLREEHNLLRQNITALKQANTRVRSTIVSRENDVAALLAFLEVHESEPLG